MNSAERTGHPATRRTAWLGLGTVLAALAASWCCILPMAVALSGVGSAALGLRLAPWRPLFLAMTALFLATAFYREYRGAANSAAACADCPPEAARRRRRLWLWIASILAVVLVTFHYYMAWLA